jgi:hypothetical protein
MFNLIVNNYENQEVGVDLEDFIELLVACLATSPNSSFDFLVIPDFCMVDNVGSFSNIFSSRPTLTFIS